MNFKVLLATGDTHGDWNRIYDFIDKHKLNEESTGIVILGDAGLFWQNNKKDAQEKIAYHEAFNFFHIFFIDGNHENFKLLKQIEIDTATGMGEISEHIHYLPRGFNWQPIVNNKQLNILCCGGADSVDRHLRIEGLSWWSEEAISAEDIKKIDSSIQYDYVLTHCCPIDIFNQYKVFLTTLNLNENIIDHNSEIKLQELCNKIVFNKWLFGHYHQDIQLNDKFQCLLWNFIELK